MKKRRVTYLVKVVVFGGHPKYGHRVHAVFGQLPGNANGGQRLVDRVGRTAEKSHLLAGNHRTGAFFETLQIGESRSSRAEELVLLAQGRSDFLSPLRRIWECPSHRENA